MLSKNVNQAYRRDRSKKKGDHFFAKIADQLNRLALNVDDNLLEGDARNLIQHIVARDDVGAQLIQDDVHTVLLRSHHHAADALDGQILHLGIAILQQLQDDAHDTLLGVVVQINRPLLQLAQQIVRCHEPEVLVRRRHLVEWANKQKVTFITLVKKASPHIPFGSDVQSESIDPNPSSFWIICRLECCG